MNWDENYKSIPKSVHKAYKRDMVEYEGEPTTLSEAVKRAKPIDLEPVSDLKSIADRLKRMKEANIRDERERLRIWTKHYKKYNLSYTPYRAWVLSL